MPRDIDHDGGVTIHTITHKGLMKGLSGTLASSIRMDRRRYILTF